VPDDAQLPTDSPRTGATVVSPPSAGPPAAVARRVGRELLVPALSIFTSLVIGGLIIWVTTGSLGTALAAYGGLFQGAFGSPDAIAAGGPAEGGDTTVAPVRGLSVVNWASSGTAHLC